MSAKSVTERVSDFRKRRAAQGLVRLEFYVNPLDVYAIKNFVADQAVYRAMKSAYRARSGKDSGCDTTIPPMVEQRKEPLPFDLPKVSLVPDLKPAPAQRPGDHLPGGAS